MADAAALLYQQIYTPPDQVATKAAIVAIAQAADLPAGDFIEGDPSERYLEVSAEVMAAWNIVPTMAVRSLFLEFATDPGDPGDLSADQTPRPGMLSAFGAGWFGTTRRGATYATGFVTVTNTGSSPATFKPFDLTFERSTPGTDGGTPTYRNTTDPSIYTGVGGTLTLAPGASKVIPVQAEQIGSYSTAAATTISHVVTQSAGTLTCSNSSAVVGTDREDRALYVARCKLAMDRLSPGGPVKAYLYAMNTAIDGTPLQRYDGTGPVNITTAQILPSNASGVVVGYYAGPSGAVDAVDRASANANVCGVSLGIISAPTAASPNNVPPLGVLPDTVDLAPATPDPTTNTDGFDTASNLALHVAYQAKIRASDVSGGSGLGMYATPWKASTNYAIGQEVQNGVRLYACASPGTSASSGGPTGTGSGIVDGSATWNYVVDAAGANTTGTLAIYTAVETALGPWLPSIGPGGLDQDGSGNGFVYTGDIQDQIMNAYAGLYAPFMLLPFGASTAVALGHVTTQGTTTGRITVVAG